MAAAFLLFEGKEPPAEPVHPVSDSGSDRESVDVATSGTVPNVTYVLSGGTNLGAHVGHRVEITGRTSGDARKAESTDSSVKRVDVPNKPDPKVETKEKATIEMRDLQIESLKMVSTSCAAKP